LLKEISFAIFPLLTLIFNASLEQGKLPSDLQKAFVTPVHKKAHELIHPITDHLSYLHLLQIISTQYF